MALYASGMPRMIDLSHPIEAGMITYPGLPGPAITDHLTRQESRSHYTEGTEFHIGRIDMVANTGTYLDTPFHRFADGFDLADLPLEKAANLPGVCLRVDGPEITLSILDGLEIEGHAVLFATGWDLHWATDHYGDPTHPFLNAEAAAEIAARGATLVGIDSVNIDDARDGSRPAHTTLLEAGIPIVEHLTGLGELVGRDFRFFALPAPVRGMGTFPVRAIAIVA
jgi:arylformamidase